MRNPNNLRKSKLALGLMAALVAAPVFAQSTSASVGGQVTAGGSPVAGAEVVITHVESGTVSRVTTDANGRYNARGLRVGGPYTITVNKAGSGTDTESNVYLSVNQTAQVDAQLQGAAGGTFDAVTVTAMDSAVFSPTKAGAGTNLTRQNLEALPSTTGNVQDYMRLDPRVAFVDRASGSISAGGQNPRYNNIRIDGVSASDTFGLEGNNMPTRRQPVAMDAIEALDIDLSNYDVTISGATGAVVNAVTKSGTNEFHGSLYGTFRDGDWFGRAPKGYGTDKVNGDKFNGFTQEKTLGATLGGPIVKDKLFFFANYEKYEQAAPGADLGASPYGAGRFTDSDIARAQTAFQNRYNVPAGGIASNGDTSLTERAVKLDWNINDSHRLSFRYSDLEQSKLRLNGFNNSSMSLSSYWYQHDKSIKSYVAQLFSDWSDSFSTELKASFRDYAAVRNTPTDGTPEIRISLDRPSDGANSTTSLFLGTETNSQYNDLFTKTWNFYGSGTWVTGNHNIKFGAEYATNDIYNVYAPYVDGQLVYNSVADFEANKPSYTQFRYPQGGDVTNMAAKYKYNTLGLFVQDQWFASDALTLTYGLRADRFTVDHNPQFNPNSVSRWGFNNSDVGGGKFLIQPRVGFNYKLSDESLAQVRGGIGLFQGESPQVWLSNAYNTTGLNYTQTETWFNPAKTRGALENMNLVAGDFEQPSVWKANLAVDIGLPWYNMIFSGEVLATKVNTALFYKRLDIATPTKQGPDGRDLYYGNLTGIKGFGTARANRPSGVGDVLLLDTTDKGSTQQVTFSLSKPMTKDSDWSWSLGYTYTNAKEVSSLTSSTATSGWNYNYIFDANEESLNRARYEIRDRVSGSLTWKHNFFGNYETKAGLVYEGRSGRPYSWVYYNDANGDSRSANDLFYVPTGPGDVIFGRTVSSTDNTFVPDANVEAAFFTWLNSQKDLNRYRGNVAPANAGRAGWVNTFDLRLSQELPGFWKGHKAELWVDVQNIGNMINKDWGNVIDYGFLADQRVATLHSIDPVTGKYRYVYSSADKPTVANSDADQFNAGISQWSVSVGLRYKF